MLNLLAMLVIVGALGAAARMLRRHLMRYGGREPVCGACGASASRFESFTCPVCGGSAVEYGLIVRPNRAPLATLALAMISALGVMLLATVGVAVVGPVERMRYSSHTYEYVTYDSEVLDRLVVTSSFYRRNDRPPVGAEQIDILLEDATAAVMSIDLPSLETRVIDLRDGAARSAGRFDQSALPRALEELGVDLADAAHATAAGMVYDDVMARAMDRPPGPDRYGTRGPAVFLGGGSGASQSPGYIEIWIIAAAMAWLGILWRGIGWVEAIAPPEAGAGRGAA